MKYTDLPHLVAANSARNLEASRRTALAAQDALRSGVHLTGEQRAALQARIDHPNATLTQIANRLRITKDMYSARLRRGLKAADRGRSTTRQLTGVSNPEIPYTTCKDGVRNVSGPRLVVAHQDEGLAPRSTDRPNDRNTDAMPHLKQFPAGWQQNTRQASA